MSIQIETSIASPAVGTRRGLQPFDRDLLVFDLETTGANPRVHQVVSIGALLLDRITLDVRRSLNTFVHLSPEGLAQADPKAMQIHGLTLEQLAGAPSAAEVVTRFLDTFGTDFYFCGWNICFDTQFLAALFDQGGRRRDFDTFRYHRLDLWSLLEITWLRGLVPDRPDSLSHVCHMFGIERKEFHDALEDARISAEVLRKTLRMFVGGEHEGDIQSNRSIADSSL